MSVEEQEQKRYEETVAAVNQELAKELAMEESDATKTETSNDKQRHPTADASILPQISRLLPHDYAEQAHLFETVTFSEPTYCDVCSGVLAGFFSQGKQCKTCGLIVHHGQRARNHSNCHAEAMVQPCAMKQEERNAKSRSIDSSKDSTCTTKKTDSSMEPQDKIAPSTASFPIQILPSLSSEEQHEIPHKFVEHSYASPTYCSICNGLLVGLWSQGFQCEVCGLNVHRGEGVDEHDDCKAEALLSSCCGEKVKQNNKL